MKRAVFGTLFAALACAQIATLQKARHPAPPDLVVSVWYNGGTARAPMLSPITPASREEWRRDLRQIKSLGFSAVRGWVDWSHNEPREGQYNFDNLKMLSQLAQEEGLKVLVQIYCGWDGFGFAPDWARKKYPDAFGDERQIYAPGATPAATFYSDHKGVRDAILKFYTETAKVAAQYPNFYAWDLWSEPHGAQLVGPETRVRYREWLQSKYGSLSRLNDSWYENYAAWDDVYPLRSGGIGTYAMDMDWGDFIDQKGAEDMGMMYDAVRKGDPTHLITSHASPPSIYSRQLDDFLMADRLDYYGLSVYPRYVGEPSLWRQIIGADFERSAGRKNGGFFAGEFQAGFSTIGLTVGDPVTPDDHRTWLWSLLAKGARGVNVYAYYVMSSGMESGGFGLIGLDGKPTDRAIELGKTARIVEENKALLVKSRPVEAQVALVYDPAIQRAGGGRSAGAAGGGGAAAGGLAAFTQNSLIGYYRTFVENNVPVDFIHRRDMESGDMSRYKLIIYPCPILLSTAAAEGIKRYVRQGGSLVAEARLAWNSDHAYASTVVPGMGLSEVFGVRETKILTRPDVGLKIVDNSDAAARLRVGDELKGAQFAESLELLPGGNGRTLARMADGAPGMVSAAYGKGQTLMIGTFLGLGNQQTPNRNDAQLLLGLLDWAKVTRPFRTSQDGLDPETPLEARLQENAGGYLLFLINHGSAAKPATVDLTVKEDGQYSLNEIVHKQVDRKSSRNKTLSFTSDLPAKQVAVWDIRRTAN